MRITTYVIAVLCIMTVSPRLFCQVGIGTTDPKSSLDIVASDPASPSNRDGILIPRIDDFPATDPGADQDGMLVFLTTASGSYSKGFHYWDNVAGQWIAYTDEWGDGTNAKAAGLIFAKQADAGGMRVAVLDNGRIGMGTDDPEESLELKLDGDNDIQISSASAPDAPQLVFYTTEGTFASPDFLNTNVDIGYITGKVWTGSGKSSDNINIQMETDGLHTASSLPSKIEFAVTASGSTSLQSGTPAMTIKNSGNVGLSVNNPTAVLHIEAGSTAASTAPLKLSAGTNMTTPEAGAMEYDGTNLYFTPATTRKVLLTGLANTQNLDFPSIAGKATAELTVTVTGATVGSVSNSAPNTTIEAGLQWSCYVSAANTVTVRVSNITNTAIDPAAKDWKITVIQ